MARSRIAHEVDEIVIAKNAAGNEQLKIFALTLNKLMYEKNVHQKSMAAALEISTGAISGYRTGKKEPKLSTIVKIADYLGVDCHYLMTGIDAGNAKSAAELGLSNAAIYNIKQATAGEKRNTLNAVIRSPQFEKLINAIWNSAYYANQRGDIIATYMGDKLNSDNSASLVQLLEPVIRGGGDIDVLFKYSASEAASTLFDEVSSEIYDEMHPARR